MARTLAASRRHGDAGSMYSSDGDPIHGFPIEADQNDSSDDSLSLLSSTKSLRDSIYDYITQNGRTYNGLGDYVLPNDPAELERLDLQYFVIQRLFGGREYFAPLRQPRRILDIGTGTGVWCVLMGELFPHTEIIGTDLAPVQKEAHGSNVSWLMEDANWEEWGNKKYDYIHTRFMLGSFEDFRTIVKRSFQNLEPGGWFESQELWPRARCDDGTMDPATHKLSEFIQYQDDCAMRIGKPVRIANKLKKWYKQAGFVDVHEEVFKIPINGWPKDPQLKMLGKWWAMSLLDGLQGFALRYLTEGFNWTAEEVEVYLVDVRKSIADKHVHAYHDFHVVWGRKPTVQEQRIIDAQKAMEEVSHGAEDMNPMSTVQEEHDRGSPPTQNGH